MGRNIFAVNTLQQNKKSYASGKLVEGNRVTVDKELTFQDVLKIMNHIYSKKNKEYGNSFEEAYRLYGDRAVGYVVTTKSRRIESLLTNPGEVNFESLEDSLLDLANYCVMSLMMLEEEKDNE